LLPDFETAPDAVLKDRVDDPRLIQIDGQHSIKVAGAINCDDPAQGSELWGWLWNREVRMCAPREADLAVCLLLVEPTAKAVPLHPTSSNDGQRKRNGS